MSADLIIPLGAKLHEVKNVDFIVTDQVYDEEPCVRLFCTQHHSAYSLQIRGLVPLNKRGGIKKPQPLIATASLTWAELVQIADYVKAVQAEMLDALDQENYQVYPAEVIRQGLESNADEFNDDERRQLIEVLTHVEMGQIDQARQIINKAGETVQFYSIKPDEK